MHNSTQVRIAVIAAAGHATRMWPASKVVPKELFPLGSTPALMHIISEFAEAGIRRIVLVTSDLSHDLIAGLLDRSCPAPKRVAGDPAVQEFVELLSEIDFTLIRQSDAYGNAVPLVDASRAIPEIQTEPCIYAFGDDIVLGENAAEGLIRTFNRTGCPVLAAQSVPDEQKRLFGIVDYFSEDGVNYITRLIEKPGPGATDSNLASFGRYLVTPELMDDLRSTPQGKDGEVWFVDAVINQIQGGKRVCVLPLSTGNWYTVGNPKSYAEAVQAAALALASKAPKSRLSPAK